MVAGKVESELPGFEKELQERFLILIRYFMAYANFILGNYDRAIDHLQPIINTPTTGMWSATKKSARLMQVLVYYEKGDFEFLPYLLRSTYRYMLQQKQLQSSEKILMKYLRRLLNIADRRELPPFFHQLQLELVNNPEQWGGEYGMGNFNLIGWLKSKTEKKSFRQVLTEELN